MSVKAMSLVWGDQTIKRRSDLLILLSIADHCDDDFLAFPGIESLARKSRCSGRSVQGAISRLVADGKLSVSYAVGPNGTNVYRVLVGGCKFCGGEKPGPEFSPESSGIIRGSTKSTPIVPKERDPIESIASEIYDLYPRKVARPHAIRAILKTIRSGTSAEYLKSRTCAYARARLGEDPQFTPHPATWFNEERFNDDPATWKNGNQTKSSSSSSKTDTQKLLEAQGYL